VFAIPSLGSSRDVPPVDTSLPGVHLVTSAQIVNGTLNVNETVQLAERAARRLLASKGSAHRTHETAENRALPAHSAGATVVAGAEASPVRRSRPRPAATLSIDLDNLWSYLKTRGDASWKEFPSFLELVVPRVLRFMDDRGQAITWFVVGQDAAMAQHRELLGAVASSGHEVGNHSFLHEPWLHRYSPERLEEELARAEDAIEQATGSRPRGFRGPGYSLSKDVLDSLARRGYRYDASTLPTFVGPLARAFYGRGASFTAEEQAERDALFGSFREGTRPLKPYRWNGAGIVEVPVTTMPVLRTPIHMSYLVYLAEHSPALARRYLAGALWLCRRAGVAPSLLLHSHDFVGADEVPAMAFFPGFRLPGEEKVRLVSQCVDLLRRDFDVVPLGDYVDRLNGLKTIEPRFFTNGLTNRAAERSAAEGAR
jgi:peptidoglycan-N-acetylglucosamine deacetylase